MPENPARRDLLKYAGAAGAVAGVGWLGEIPSAQAATFGTTTAPAQPASQRSAGTGLLDTLVFGDTASESAHALTATLSDTVAAGGLGQTARVLNPTSPVGYYGGTLSFTLACSPTGTTYVTVKLWGDEYDSTSEEDGSGTNMWRLQLFCEGLQIGYQDQGEVDNLDILDTAPRTPGRFFFHTLPLPEKLTAGKTSVALEIRSMGRIWSYGQNQAQLYYDMTTPSRAIYRLYTHTDPYFTAPAGDVQGPAPVPTARTVEGPEVLTAIRARVLSDTTRLLTTADPATLDGWAMQQLAESYFWSGGPGYQSDTALDRTLQAIDGRYYAWQANPTVLTGSDQQWQGFGRIGLVLALLWEQLGTRLDQQVTGSPYSITNGGFENGSGATATGWSVAGWTANGTASRDSTYAHSGTYSMKLVHNATGANAIAVNNNTKVSLDQGAYEYGVWVKGQDLTGTGVYLDVLFYDAAGAIVGTDNKVFAPAGTYDWTYLSSTLTTPATAVSAWLFIGVHEGGTAWIDDVTLIATSTSSHAAPVRRTAYTAMLTASRDYWREHFPHYSNQTQICAIGLYQVNRALRLIDPALAWTEDKARSFMYQSVGLTPYLGPEAADGAATVPLGHSYYQVTVKGLTRELGYVGNYGEVTDWLIMMYESITRGYQPQDDPTLKAQIIKMVKTRSRFRILDVDEAGGRVARLETVVGWRNEVYPGEVGYAQRTAWDSHPIQAAVVLKDPEIIGWTQEMFADGQFYRQLDLMTSNSWTRVGLNAFRLVTRDWDAYQALPSRPYRLPTDWNAPDFCFTDEEDGVVAVKNGGELLYASLYWRARQGVNNYARVHHVTPVDQRSATIRQNSSGATDTTFTALDWILWDYAINDPGAAGIPPGGFPPPGDTLHQSLAGDVYPLAPVPADVPDPTLGVHFTGVETMLVGRAPLYLCQYGDYYIAMNTTTDKTYTLPHRQAFGPATDLTTGKKVKADARVTVLPMTTVVLYRKS